MPSIWFYLCVALALSASETQVKAFTFNFTNPSQCQNLTVTWTGGKPPFTLLIIPPKDPVRSLSIPPSAYQGNSGSFSTPLLFNETQQLMLSMSDFTGVSAGGISDLLTVGPPQGAICNTTGLRDDYYFSLDSNLQQCKPYPFTLYSGAKQPITITGFVPLGNSFVLNPPEGDSFSWTANLPAGTRVTFSMIDSLGRSGGSSPIEVVLLTNDTSCLTAKQTSISKNRLKVATIIVATVGGFEIIGIAAFLFFRFKKIWRAKSGYGSAQSEVDFPYDPLNSTLVDPFILPEGYTSTPFDPNAPPRDNALVSPFILQLASTAIPPSSQFDRAKAPPQSSNSSVTQGDQPRVILHTDIEESTASPVELPPEYSETRSLIPGLSASNDAGSSSAPARSRLVAPAKGKRV